MKLIAYFCTLMCFIILFHLCCFCFNHTPTSLESILGGVVCGMFNNFVWRDIF